MTTTSAPDLSRASEPAVLVEGLAKRFGETRALDGIDLRVDRASVVGLLGPNGAGKTTAVRAITTLIRPDAGTIRVDGIDVLTDPMRAKARIGLTGQYAAVDERLTAFENLQHVGRLFHMRTARARERARELLDRFDLADAADRPVKGFSGGMRRRLDIAMSLIAQPSVLFLDEPTTGLDPRSRNSVWDLIEELKAAGTTTLLTTQHLEEADRLADEIVVIDHGKVIARGTGPALKQQVGADTVEVVLGDTGDADGVVSALSSIACGAAITEPHEDGRRTVVRIPVAKVDGLTPTVVRMLDTAGVHYADVAGRQATLDDVFFALTGHPTEDPSQPAAGQKTGSTTSPKGGRP